MDDNNKKNIVDIELKTERFNNYFFYFYFDKY